MDYHINEENHFSFSFPEISEIKNTTFSVGEGSSVKLIAIKPKNDGTAAIEAIYGNDVSVEKKACCTCSGWTACGSVSCSCTAK